MLRSTAVPKMNRPSMFTKDGYVGVGEHIAKDLP
jgi:hypothetical protein